MTIPVEIKQVIEKQLDLMTEQTRAYLPFVKLAFPNVKDLSEGCFNLIIGNVFQLFLTQYAMRMKSPTEEDFSEFGLIAQKCREKIKKMF